MSMGIIESGEYNKVAGLGGDGEANVVVGEYATAKVISVPINSTPVNYLKVNLKKGTWIVHARVRTDVSNEDNVILSMYLSQSPDITQGNAVMDQRAQLPGIWHFSNGFLPITLTEDKTLYIRLTNTSSLAALQTIDGTVYAVRVA